MKVILVLCCVMAAMLSSMATASDVITVTPENIDSLIDGSKNTLLEIYAPWCGHCKTLAPEYELVGTAFKGNKENVVVAKLDGDAHKDLSGRFDVKGFPTVLFFKKGSTTSKPYEGARTAEAIVAFLNDEAGARGHIKKASSAVRALTSASWNAAVDGSKNVLVEFYAPWCGHCKTLAPKWEELGKIFANEKNVIIAKVDADSAEGRALGEKFEVKGFPTIKFFPAGQTTPDEYGGGREVSDFVTFLNEKAGTKRTSTGSLAASAGRHDSLDELAAALASGAKKSVSADVKKAVAALSADDRETAKFYEVVAAKVEKEGQTFVTAQIARLTKMIGDSAVSAPKRDEFTVKLNILNAFVAN